MARVHRLEHVDRLGAANLTDDDAVGPHAESVPHEVADANLALPLDVGRPRLERDDVLLVELQLGCVLDRQDPLAVGDETRHHVQERRLADARAARDQDVELPAHAALEHLDELRRQRAQVDEIAPGQRVGRELADGQDRPLQRERRHDHVDARAVGQAGIHHRRGFVDAAADSRDDPLDDAHQMGVVGEAGVGLVEHTCALDEHLVVAVHHHLGDPVVAQERIDRPVAEHLVDHVLDDALALVRR